MPIRIAILLFIAGALLGQEKIFTSQPATPENLYLELIDLEEDPKKQLTLLENFTVRFSNYAGMNIIYAQMQDDCVKLAMFDRALELGDKILAGEPGDIEAVRLNLEAAKGKKDEALIAKWGARLQELEQIQAGNITATSTINLPYVETGEELNAAQAAGKPLTKYQKARLEALTFNSALDQKDPAMRLLILDKFRATFPESQHMAKAEYLYFLAYRDRGDSKNALAAAESIVKRDQTREDVLLFLARDYFQRKRELDKVVSYSTSVLDLVNGKPKAESVPDAEWAKHRAAITQDTHWMIGTAHLYAERWQLADRHLRSALQAGRFNAALTAGILNNLAWANYKLRNIPDALQFYKECAEIPGPLQAAANQSIVSIRSEYNLQQ